MLELLRQLEEKRQVLRRQLLGDFSSDYDHSFFGLAFLVFMVSLFPMIVFPPSAIATVMPGAVMVGALVFVGFFFAATIILLPLSFIFF